MTTKLKAIKGDDWANAVTKLGTTGDKSYHTQFASSGNLAPEELNDLYKGGGLARRIVDRMPDDAFREGWEIEDPNVEFDVKSLESQLEDLDADTQLGDAWRWARLFGGAIAILAVNDGRKFDEPLDLDNATGIAGLSVVDSRFAIPENYDAGLGSRAFALPTYYTITLPMGRQLERRIHRSRVIRFDGCKVSPIDLASGNGWGPSVLQQCYDTMRRLGATRRYGEHIMHHVSLLVLKMPDFRKMMKGTDTDRRTLDSTLDTIKECMDALHMLVFDAVDELDRSETAVLGGIVQVVQRAIDDLVADTDLPRSILLGETPGGINTGENAGETRAWYDHVHAQQRKILTKRINRLLSVLFAIRKNRGETVPDEWTIGYRPLWQLTENEAADVRTKNAAADTAYHTMGAISADEIRTQRFEAGNTGDLRIEQPTEPEGMDPDVQIELPPG